jgi:hypothetical protein
MSPIPTARRCYRGVAAAAGAGYAASHQTTTYSSYGTIGNRQFFSSGMIQTYDPASGIFAGAVVGALKLPFMLYKSLRVALLLRKMGRI